MSRSKTGFFVAVPPHTGSAATPAIAFAPLQALTFRRQEALAPRREARIQLSLRKGSRVIPIMLLPLSVALFLTYGLPSGHQQLGLALGLIKDINEPLSIEALQKQLSDKPRPRPRRPADRRGAIASEEAPAPRHALQAAHPLQDQS